MDTYTLWVGCAVLIGGLVGYIGGMWHGFRRGFADCRRLVDEQLVTLDRFMEGELRALLKRADSKAKERQV